MKKNTSEKKAKRGFAAMSKDRQRAIARKGGKAAHRKGTAHKWTSEEAAHAGAKGGLAAQKSGKAWRWNSETARKASRKGVKKRKPKAA